MWGVHGGDVWWADKNEFKVRCVYSLFAVSYLINLFVRNISNFYEPILLFS